MNKFVRYLVFVSVTMIIITIATACDGDDKALSVPDPTPSVVKSTQENQELQPPIESSPSPNPQIQIPVHTGTLPPKPPLPDFSDGFFFAEDSINGCHLPCWQGLVIGESGRNDVQLMLDTQYGFGGFLWPVEWYGLVLPDNVDTISHRWQIKTESQTTEFNMLFFLNNDTDTLLEIYFSWNSIESFTPPVSPQRILQELGKPSDWLIILNVSFESTEIESIMIYDDAGLVFNHYGELPFHHIEDTSGNIIATDLDFCLERNNLATVFDIGSPLSTDAFQLSPIRQLYLEEAEVLRPIENVFEFSIEDEIPRLTSQKSACLATRIPRGDWLWED